MIVNLGHGYTATWNRGHYVNYSDEQGRDYDCVSFAWEKNNPTFMDAWDAFYNHETDGI